MRPPERSAAFSTSFSRVALAGRRERDRQPEAPSLDSAIADDVQGVLGLDTWRSPSRC